MNDNVTFTGGTLCQSSYVAPTYLYNFVWCAIHGMMNCWCFYQSHFHPVVVSPPQTCPICGHCPTCGRGGHDTPPPPAKDAV